MSSNFYARAHVKFTHIKKKIEAIYQTSRVNGNVERGSTSLRLRWPSLHLPIIYARKIYVCACARKNYSTVEIHIQKYIEGPE